MSIQVLVLETGDTVIGDISEVMDKEKNASLGYRVTDPYIVNYNYGEPDPNAPQGEVQAQSARLDFNFWAPLALDRTFDFVTDFVRVIYTPQDSVVELYMQTLGKHKTGPDSVNVEVDTTKTIVSLPPEDNPATQGQTLEQGEGGQLGGFPGERSDQLAAEQMTQDVADLQGGNPNE